MTITLTPLTIDNWMDVIELDVTPEQQKFVRSNLFTLAEANFYPDAKVRGISHENQLIGLAFYGFDPQDNKCWLLRIMIDKKYQNKGLGRTAMLLIFDDVRKSFSTQFFYLSVVPANQGAIKFYERMGFVFTGEYKDLGWTPLQKVYRIMI